MDHSLWPLLRSYESNGSSEEILGSVLLKKVRRDEVVIATKVFGQVRPGPNGRGLSRKAILAEIGNSLRRLGTDYIDLYIIHRWDSSTPIKETLQALHDVVAAGKVRMFRLACAPRWTLRSSTKVATKAAAPYGYKVVDGGPHPNPREAAEGYKIAANVYRGGRS